MKIQELKDVWRKDENICIDGERKGSGRCQKPIDTLRKSFKELMEVIHSFETKKILLKLKEKSLNTHTENNY